MPEHDIHNEGAQMIALLRALNNEDQRIAYAILEGMRLQQTLDHQRDNPLFNQASAVPVG